MTITITITAENAAALAQDLYNLVPALRGSATTTVAPDAVSVVINTPEERKAKKEKAEKEEVKEAPTSEFTLQQCIDRAREIAGDGKDEAVMKKLHGVIIGLGIDKVRNLPVEKLGDFMAEVDKAFPKANPNALFD